MDEEPVKRILKNVGLTDREADVYIFLARQGALKGLEIARQLRIDRAEVYRILKRLQDKGLSESTRETPTRFTIVPFEKVLESFVKTKRDEVALIERTKDNLLEDWKKISKRIPEPTTEKFMVIEGNRRIYPKILKMISETKNQLSAMATVPGLLRADQFGILDAAFSHPLESKIQFRFLTELSKENLNIVKSLLKRMQRTGIDFRGKSPDLGLHLTPRMVIRDDEEIIFFMAPKNGTPVAEQDDVCLWTNCKTLIQPFVAIFDDSWSKSTNVEQKILEIETGKPTPQTYLVISNADCAKRTYDRTVYSAKEEIIMLTSVAGLFGLCKNKTTLKECAGRGVSIRIMAPLTSENLEVVQQLSEFSEVRHAQLGYLSTTLVDRQHLFQFKNPQSDQEKIESPKCFENTLDTTDPEYVYKMRTMLNETWKNALSPSAVTIDSTGQSLFRKINGYIEEEKLSEKLTEKDILTKIIYAQRIPLKGKPAKYISRCYGSIAQAIIHPPIQFNLPEMMIWLVHNNEQSSFGAEDWLAVYLKLETPFGKSFLPVVHVTTSSKSVPHRKAVFAGTPAEKNIRVAKKNELKVRAQGNTLFAGWTMPIPLSNPHYILPPSSILFEGYGQLRTGVLKTRVLSGRTQTYEYNGFGAFVTFFHPSSKYVGPGTDGILLRDVIMTAYPPPG